MCKWVIYEAELEHVQCTWTLTIPATNVDIQTNWSCTWTWIILATIVETGEEKQIKLSHAILTSNVKMSKYEAEIGLVHGH